MKCSNSGLIVKTSGHSRSHLHQSCDHRLYFPGFGSNFVSEGKIFGMQKNWPKFSRKLIFVLTSCVYFAHRKAIVMASCHRDNRDIIVITSYDHRWYREFSTHGNKKLPDCLTKANDYVMPSQYCRVAIVLKYDGIEMGSWCWWRQPNFSRYNACRMCHVTSARNSTFHIRVSICSQIRDSATPT